MTNWIPNPIAATDTAGWTAPTNRSIARTVTLPGTLPPEFLASVMTGLQASATANLDAGQNYVYTTVEAEAGPAMAAVSRTAPSTST